MAKIRKDAKVETLEKKLEKDHGLPEGSVKIVDPKTGRDVRGDKRVDKIRKNKK